jgi:sortase (surface protein transpeptidase)
LNIFVIVIFCGLIILSYNGVVAISEATVHKQWEKTKAQEPEPEHKTKDNHKLFSQQ